MKLWPRNSNWLQQYGTMVICESLSLLILAGFNENSGFRIFFPKLHFAPFFAFIMATFPFNWRQTLLPPIIFLIAFSPVSVYALTMEKKNIRRHILGREGPEQLKGGGYFLIVMCLTNSSVHLWPTFLAVVLSQMQNTELGRRKWVYWEPTVCLYLGFVSLNLQEVFLSPFAGEEMRRKG